MQKHPMKNPNIPDNVRPLVLQSILYFLMAKEEGKTRAQAVEAFVGSPLCEAFGVKLTVSNVYGFASAAGYPED